MRPDEVLPLFIEGLKREIEPFRACASYNGKAFDLPIIRTRFVMAIRSELTVDDSHLDLLHPARRLRQLVDQALAIGLRAPCVNR